MKNKKIKAVKKTRNKKYSTLLKYIKCLLPGLAVTAAGVALLAFLYCRDSQNNRLFYYAVYAAIGAGAFITGFAACSLLKGRGILTGALGGLPFALMIIATASIVLKGEVSLFILVILPVSVILSAVGGIVSANWSAKM